MTPAGGASTPQVYSCKEFTVVCPRKVLVVLQHTFVRRSFDLKTNDRKCIKKHIIHSLHVVLMTVMTVDPIACMLDYNFYFEGQRPCAFTHGHMASIF